MSTRPHGDASLRQSPSSFSSTAFGGPTVSNVASTGTTMPQSPVSQLASSAPEFTPTPGGFVIGIPLGSSQSKSASEPTQSVSSSTSGTASGWGPVAEPAGVDNSNWQLNNWAAPNTPPLPQMNFPQWKTTDFRTGAGYYKAPRHADIASAAMQAGARVEAGSQRAAAVMQAWQAFRAAAKSAPGGAQSSAPPRSAPPSLPPQSSHSKSQSPARHQQHQQSNRMPLQQQHQPSFDSHPSSPPHPSSPGPSASPSSHSLSSAAVNNGHGHQRQRSGQMPSSRDSRPPLSQSQRSPSPPFQHPQQSPPSSIPGPSSAPLSPQQLVASLSPQQQQQLLQFHQLQLQIQILQQQQQLQQAGLPKQQPPHPQQFGATGMFQNGNTGSTASQPEQQAQLQQLLKQQKQQQPSSHYPGYLS